MIKNIFKVFFSNGIIAVAGLASSLLLPNILSVEEYAEYQTFILYLGYATLFHFGFPNGLNIKYAGKNWECIDKSQLKSEMRLLIIALIFFTILVSFVSMQSKNNILILATFMIFSYCYLNSLLQLLEAWGNFDLYFILRILISAFPQLLPLIIYFLSNEVNSLIAILSYIVIYCMVSVVFVVYYHTVLKKYKSKKILSRENLETEKIGFWFHMGSYINVLFNNIDKQFVQWFCSVQEFSYFSFSLTLQHTMTIFLSAVGRPLFPYLATEKNIRHTGFTTIKRYLLMLGSASGIAFFACCFVVERWIPTYIDSLNIIRVYFAVFPAMAVVNCMYFNLYKIRMLKERYIFDTFIMLILAILANSIAVKLKYKNIGIAVATTIIYYIWLFYGTTIFKELKIDAHECFFITAFLIIFIFIPLHFETVPGVMVYFIADIMICCVCFPHEIMALVKLVLRLL